MNRKTVILLLSLLLSIASQTASAGTEQNEHVWTFQDKSGQIINCSGNTIGYEYYTYLISKGQTATSSKADIIFARNYLYYDGDHLWDMDQAVSYNSTGTEAAADIPSIISPPGSNRAVTYHACVKDGRYVQGWTNHTF